jgi:L,D-transpeptidase ErfK/SrfK
MSLNMKCVKKILVLGVAVFLSAQACALEFSLPKHGNTMVGSIDTVTMQPNQDLFWIARHHDVALDDLKRANQGMQDNMTAIDHVAIIPKQYILPDVPHYGIVVNIATKRLYYFPAGKSYFYTVPVGIGKPGWVTPVGRYRIDEKIRYPIWIVPDSIMQYRIAHGDPVTKIVRPGPADPLGKFAMRLSNHHYLIHSTNEPDGVGQRSSAGCIRVYPNDIAYLFPMIPVHTQVSIINQPNKIGVFNHKLYVQIYPPYKSDPQQENSFIVKKLLHYVWKHHLHVKQWHKELAKTAVDEATGIPVAVAELR